MPSTPARRAARDLADTALADAIAAARVRRAQGLPLIEDIALDRLVNLLIRAGA